MSTNTNSTNYVNCEDNASGEQLINIDYQDQDIKSGDILLDEKGNSFLVVGVKNEFVNCITDKFEVCSINRNWIGNYSIVSSIDVVGFIEFIKEAQYDE